MNTNERRFNEEDLLGFALLEARKSPDPSTQNGAILASPSGLPQWSTLANNEFPEGVVYNDERWERPLKYSYIEHAERGAIYKAAKTGVATKGLFMYCPWAACADCARGIIRSGISRLYTLSPTANTNPRWLESIEVALGMLKEAHISVHFIDNHYGIKLRRDGELVEF